MPHPTGSVAEPTRPDTRDRSSRPSERPFRGRSFRSKSSRSVPTPRFSADFPSLPRSAVGRSSAPPRGDGLVAGPDLDTGAGRSAGAPSRGTGGDGPTSGSCGRTWTCGRSATLEARLADSTLRSPAPCHERRRPPAPPSPSRSGRVQPSPGLGSDASIDRSGAVGREGRPRVTTNGPREIGALAAEVGPSEEERRERPRFSTGHPPRAGRTRVGRSRSRPRSAVGSIPSDPFDNERGGRGSSSRSHRARSTPSNPPGVRGTAGPPAGGGSEPPPEAGRSVRASSSRFCRAWSPGPAGARSTASGPPADEGRTWA